MAAPFPDLSEPEWDTRLVQLLVEAATAIARLDQRISATSLASAWERRASWTGYAHALNAHGIEIEEIDIFAMECGVPIPFRSPITTVTAPFERLPIWRSGFAANARRHWADDLPFSFDPPADWSDRPLLLRALELQARRARADDHFSTALELPLLLQRLGATQCLLPNLVVGDKAYRLAPQDKGCVRRYLRKLLAAAQDGLSSIEAMESGRRHFAVAIANSFRPGKLSALAALLTHHPVISPTRAAKALDISLSGAGKLLKRAASLGLIAEANSRHNWQLHLSVDLAVRFGFKPPLKGRPPSAPRGSDRLDTVLQEFDAQMEAFERTLQTLDAYRPAGSSTLASDER